MKRITGWVLLFLALVTGQVMAVEEAEYEVLLEDGDFEVRRYAPHIVAETRVEGNFSGAGNRAFGRLFGYISGDNRGRQDIAMTAPVTQETAGEEIAMTAPVGQQRADGHWAISFVMPAAWTLDTLPEPDNPAVRLRQVPAQTMVALRYSGFWSEKNYRRHREELERWMASRSLVAVGEPVWARYNAPFVPWFLRRNEVLVPVAWPEP